MIGEQFDKGGEICGVVANVRTRQRLPCGPGPPPMKLPRCKLYTQWSWSCSFIAPGGSYAWHHRLVVQARVRSNEKQQTSGSKWWDDVVPHLLAVRRTKIVRIIMYAPDLIRFAESLRAVVYPVILSHRCATKVPVSFKSSNR
jgi:hypothetical protein